MPPKAAAAAPAKEAQGSDSEGVDYAGLQEVLKRVDALTENNAVLSCAIRYLQYSTTFAKQDQSQRHHVTIGSLSQVITYHYSQLFINAWYFPTGPNPDVRGSYMD